MVRILLIEDDSTIAAGLAYSLEQEGHLQGHSGAREKRLRDWRIPAAIGGCRFA